MVVSSQLVFQSSVTETCKPIKSLKPGIPIIDLSRPTQKYILIEACQQFGFFKVINHGISVELIAKLEEEAIRFFDLSQSEKENARNSYGNKRIGPNGDVGWIEYLLFPATQQYVSGNTADYISDSFM